MFGADCPGVGAARNKATGKTYDDIKPYIEGFSFLSAAEKKTILEDNARKLFKIA